MSDRRGRWIGAASGALLLVWILAAWLAADPNTLPGPLRVSQVLIKEASSGALWLHLSATLLRVLAAFAIAMSVGTVLGLLMGRSQRANQWLNPWLIVLLNLPALDDMARSFDMPPGDRLRHVVLPQLAPHLASAARSDISLIWKIVLVVEFLGRSSGIGFQIHSYFQLFDVPHVLAYAISFVLKRFEFTLRHHIKSKRVHHIGLSLRFRIVFCLRFIPKRFSNAGSQIPDLSPHGAARDALAARCGLT
ncbi:ABC transporter permease [Halovulum sp. GXIMD14793]